MARITGPECAVVCSLFTVDEGKERLNPSHEKN